MLQPSEGLVLVHDTDSLRRNVGHGAVWINVKVNYGVSNIAQGKSGNEEDEKSKSDLGS